MISLDYILLVLFQVAKYLAFVVLISVILSFVFYLLLNFLRNRASVISSLNMVLLQITVPKKTEEKGLEARREEKQLIAKIEQLFANFAALREKGIKRIIYGEPTITLEIASVEGEILFFIAVPRRYQTYIEKQIHAFYPKAAISDSSDYTIFDPDDYVETVALRLAKSSHLPIHTYQTLEVDPLIAIASALSKLKKEDDAAVQIVMRYAGNKWRKKGYEAARAKIKEEKERKGFIRKTLSEAFGTKKKEAPSYYEQEEMMRLTPAEEEEIRAIENKASKTGFYVNIRLLAACKQPEDAKTNIAGITGAFSQYATANLNRFKKVSIYNKKKFIYNYIFRNFSKRNSFILNTEELASIFHFPLETTEVPNIRWLGAEKAAAPVNLPEKGLVLGINIHRGIERFVRLTEDDRRRHLYAVGQTGTGKTTLFKNLIIQDMKEGNGVGVVDPHGELIEELLTFIPKERAEDVILFDPADLERPLGLNMLEYKSAEQMDFAVAEMIRIFEKMFPPEYIGPMFEHNMRNAMLLLMANQKDPGTIVEIPRVFTDVKFVRTKLPYVTDPLVKSFWEEEEARTTEFHKSEKLGYIISKVGRFVENRMMRNIIGQPHSAFDFREVMDKGKILLVNLSKGKVGEVNSQLLGLIVVSKLQMSAMARVTTPERERRDFHLYLDEFQNFVTESIGTILSEARKYHLCLNITHQFIGQLPENIRSAVFGNVGTIISFRVGPQDAEFLEKEFAPVFDQNDLINIDFANAYIKLLINGTPSVPFSMKTMPPPIGGNPALAEKIRELSRLKYGKERKVVEEDIMRRFAIGKTPTPTFIPGEIKR